MTSGKADPSDSPGVTECATHGASVGSHENGSEERHREPAGELREVAEQARQTDTALRQLLFEEKNEEVARRSTEQKLAWAEQARRNAEHLRQLAGGARDAAFLALDARQGVATAVEELRNQVADQQRLIEELLATIEELRRVPPPSKSDA